MTSLSPISPLRVLFENDHLIAVDKPAGQAVIPGRNLGEDTPPLVDSVSKKLKKKAWVVHRLDRETSGIVVFAKDAPTHRDLCLLWEKREVEKIYRALVEGSVPMRRELRAEEAREDAERAGGTPAGKDGNHAD